VSIIPSGQLLILYSVCNTISNCLDLVQDFRFSQWCVCCLRCNSLQSDGYIATFQRNMLPPPFRVEVFGTYFSEFLTSISWVPKGRVVLITQCSTCNNTVVGPYKSHFLTLHLLVCSGAGSGHLCNHNFIGLDWHLSSSIPFSQ